MYKTNCYEVFSYHIHLYYYMANCKSSILVCVAYISYATIFINIHKKGNHNLYIHMNAFIYNYVETINIII